MDAKEEVFRIVGLMVEGQATQDEIEQLTDLLKSDQSLVDIYTQYMCLHSQLTWDTAHTQHSLPETEVPAEVREVAVTVARRDTQRPLRAAVAAAVVAAAAGGGAARPLANIIYLSLDHAAGKYRYPAIA